MESTMRKKLTMASLKLLMLGEMEERSKRIKKKIRNREKLQQLKASQKIHQRRKTSY